ncbi:MAG TPA: YcbK family protein [Rhizomicrobium sp.]|nr:YcbK family protein [Rhizomicrobium sp.]
MPLTLERRRLLVGAGAAFAVFCPFSSALAEIAHAGARTLDFNNIHTGEKLKIDYWADGSYVPDALETINHLLRDYRNGEVHVIEPKLLDLLTILNARLETSAPFEVISGYRSPATNAMLREEHHGVAAKSLHMQGMAIDIRVRDRSLQNLHNAALGLHAGGVGYYPTSDFVHVDVGRVRTWGGV